MPINLPQNRYIDDAVHGDLHSLSDTSGNITAPLFCSDIRSPARPYTYLNDINNSVQPLPCRKKGNAFTHTMCMLLLLSRVDTRAALSELSPRLSPLLPYPANVLSLDAEGGADIGFSCDNRTQVAASKLAYRAQRPVNNARRNLKEQDRYADRSTSRPLAKPDHETLTQKAMAAITYLNEYLKKYDFLAFPSTHAASPTLLQVPPSDTLSESDDGKMLFAHFNELANFNDQLFALAEERKNHFFANSTQAINTFLEKYKQQHPSLKGFARKLLAKNIRSKFNIDLNPDKTFFIHFDSSIGCPDSYTGWCHSGTPREFGPLTRYLFTNFPAEAQENIDTLNSMCGIYDISPSNITDFNHEHQVRILPEAFARLVWEIDFFKQATDAYSEIYKKKDLHIKKRFLNFIIHFASHRPDEDTIDDILAGIGLKKNDDVAVSLFDINGYQASNLFLFTNKKTLKITLYLPKHPTKFISFFHLYDMRMWVINNCVDQMHRNAISAHFSLYNRQDGIIYDGIEKWLNTLHHPSMAEKYFSKICTLFTPIAHDSFFSHMIDLERERFFSDLKIMVKSNREILRDIWERDIDATNVLPNPITPFLSLGFHLEHTFDSDTAQERNTAWHHVASDALNLVLMVVMDKMVKFDTEGYSFINSVKQDMGSNMPAEIMQNILPIDEMNLIGFEKKYAISTARHGHHLYLSKEALTDITATPTIDKSLFYQVKPNEQGILSYTDPTTLDTALALHVNGHYYRLRPGSIEATYVLDNGQEIILYDGVYYKRNPIPADAIHYTPCRTKRAPGGTCLHLSEGVNTLLSKSLDQGMTSSEVGETRPHATYLSLHVDTNGALFLDYNDTFFEVKPAKSGFKILGKKKTGIVNNLKGRKALGKFHFSRMNGMYYLNTPVEYTMESLGCSTRAAELHNFNVKNMPGSDKITSGEMYAIKSYGNMGFDPINSYLQEGLPKTAHVPLNSPEELEAAVNNIRSLLKKLPSYKGEVYRGGMLTPDELAALKPGDLVKSHKFLSTSADKNIAQNYALSKGAEGTFFIMKVKSKGHPIGYYTMRINEAEVLIEDGTLFRCKAVYGRNIELEELSDREASKATSVKMLAM